MGEHGRERRPAPSLPVPEMLEASRLDPPCEEFALLSWPMEPVVLPAGKLTAAETAIAELAIAGVSNGEIARARGRSVRTVANQLASIYRKLAVGSRSELAAYLAGFSRPQGRRRARRPRAS